MVARGKRRGAVAGALGKARKANAEITPGRALFLLADAERRQVDPGGGLVEGLESPFPLRLRKPGRRRIGKASIESFSVNLQPAQACRIVAGSAIGCLAV